MDTAEMKLGIVPRLVRRLKAIDAPVLVQEMRVRQRGPKAFAVILAYLLILSVAAVLALYFGYPTHPTASDMAELGRQFFAVVSFVQLIMICLIVPAYSSTSVSGERERGTFDLLALTVISSASIVTQKLAAAVGQALMLIFASLPILAIVFLLGGVSPGEVLIAYLILLSTALALGTLGMLCSCCLRNSKGSTFLTYLIMFCSYAGVPIALAWIADMSHSYSYQSFDTSTIVLFLLGFLFVGAVGSVLVYAPLALVMHARPIWRVRAFRMSIFGAVYAVVLLMVTCKPVTDMAFGGGSSDLPFLLYVNPFVSLFLYMDAHYGYRNASAAVAALIATFALSIGCTIVFRYISSVRLNGLRSL